MFLRSYARARETSPRTPYPEIRQAKGKIAGDVNDVADAPRGADETAEVERGKN